MVPSRGRLIALFLTLLGSPACSRCSSTQQAASAAALQQLKALRPRYGTALARGRAWLDALRVDPVELRARGIKGKKKLVEQLEAYYKLWQVAPSAERPPLIARIRQVVAITAEDRYHDMATVSDRVFKQDATSYLRAALLMDRLGLDTTRYRQEIRRIQPRLDEHLARRGPHQRRVFHWYYQHFGLHEPFNLAGALQAGVIAHRPESSRVGDDGAYEITHEIYALYEYGDRLDVDPFDAADKKYLREILPVLVRRYVAQRNPDLAGELVECMHYLRQQELPAYLEGVRFLLDSQNSDGSWGHYERYQPMLGDLIRQGYLLHTTLVALEALVAVFDRPMSPVTPH